MKKAEIIKNGNVNLEPAKQTDWDLLFKQYRRWVKQKTQTPMPNDCFCWFKKRLS